MIVININGNVNSIEIKESENQSDIIERNIYKKLNKKDLKNEIISRQKYYIDLKNNNPDFKGNIDKLIASDLGISKSTVVRNKKQR